MELSSVGSMGSSSDAVGRRGRTSASMIMAGRGGGGCGRAWWVAVVSGFAVVGRGGMGSGVW